MHYSELNYNSSTAVRALLEQRGLRLQKRFGQNFLLDPHYRSLICRAAAPYPCRVWEIGSGAGALTSNLVEAGCELTAFEIDHGLVRILRELFDPPGLEIIAGDCVLTLPQHWKHSQPPEAVVGNLPYSSASAIIMALLEQAMVPQRMIAMVQRESALRMTAQPGSRDYSAFSVACQARCQVASLFDVPPQAFFPRPEVVSTVVRLQQKQEAVDLPPFFAVLVRRAFQSRRKTIRNNYRGAEIGKGLTGEQVLEACVELGLRPESRAEQLSVDQYISLARALARQEPRPE